jgi:hypothetical protein
MTARQVGLKHNEAVDEQALPTASLRSLALVHSYCGREQDAARIWDRICQRDDMTLGDCYMLASSQVVLGQDDEAISNFRRAIEISKKSGDSSYLGVSAIHLAFLLLSKGARDEAREVLAPLGDPEGTYVHGVGQVTKRSLLERLRK